MSTTWRTSALAFGLVGLFEAAHYPVLRARAFAALPDKPNVVLAAGSLFGSLDLTLPLLVGAVGRASRTKCLTRAPYELSRTRSMERTPVR